jgi:hypothetical protein
LKSNAPCQAIPAPAAASSPADKTGAAAVANRENAGIAAMLMVLAGAVDQVCDYELYHSYQVISVLCCYGENK